MGNCCSTVPEEMTIPLLQKTPIKPEQRNSGSNTKILAILEKHQSKGKLTKLDFDEVKTSIDKQDISRVTQIMEKSVKQGILSQSDHLKWTQRVALEQWYTKNIGDKSAWEMPLETYFSTTLSENDQTITYGPDGKIAYSTFDNLIKFLLLPRTEYDISEQDMYMDLEQILFSCNRALADDELLLKKLLHVYFSQGIIVSSKLSYVLIFWLKHQHTFWNPKFFGDLIKFAIQSDFDEELIKTVYLCLNRPTTNAPSVQIPKEFKKSGRFNLLDWTATELARQITIRDSEMFQKIQPEEYLDHPNFKKTPNLTKLMDGFENLSHMIATLILSENDLDQRIEYLMAAIDLAEALYQLRNYHSSAAIIEALQSPPVCRISHTWNQISDESEQLYTQYKQLYFTRKYNKFLKDTIEKTQSPCIPYFIAFIQEWKEYKESEEMSGAINLGKFRLISKTLVPILRASQLGVFNFNPIPEVQEFFSKAEKLDDKELMQLSKQLEN